MCAFTIQDATLFAHGNGPNRCVVPSAPSFSAQAKPPQTHERTVVNVLPHWSCQSTQWVGVSEALGQASL